MSSSFVYGLYGLAGVMFLLSAVFMIRPIRILQFHWGWASLAIVHIGLAGWMGFRIYLLLSPDPSGNMELGSAAVTAILSCLAFAGNLILGKRTLENIQLHQDLQFKANQLSESFEKSPLLLVIKDIQGVYQATNHAYRSFLGKKETDLAGETDFKFFPRAQANSFRLEEEKVIQSGQTRSRDEEIYGAEGARLFRIDRIPIFDSANQVLGIMVSGQDITASKYIENTHQVLTQRMSLLGEAEKDICETAGSTNQWDQILSWAGKLGATEHSAIWSMAPERAVAEMMSGCGKLAKMAGLQMKAGADVAWKVWQSHQVEWIPNGTSDNHTKSWMHEQGFSAAIGLPLTLRGQVAFVLVLYYEVLPNLVHEDGNLVFSLFAQFLSANLQFDDQVVNSQTSIEEARRNLAEQTKLHQVEESEWQVKLEDRITANRIEAEDWKRRMDAVQYRLRLEHIVAVIASHLISLDHTKVDEAISRSLQTVVKFAGADRGYLSLFPKDIYQPMGQPSWYSNTLTDTTETAPENSGPDFQWGLGRLNQLETIHIPRVSELDPDKDESAVFLSSRGIRSFSAVPLVSNRSVIGYLGFESHRVELEWSNEILALWKVFADMLVNLLERKWAAIAQEDNQEHINQVISELEQQNQEGILMTEMGDLLQACRTADEAYPIIIRYIQRLLPAGSGALYMIHDPKDPAEMVAVWGKDQPSQVEHELVLNECWALRRGRIYSVENPALEPVCGHIKTPIHYGYLCVPMIAQGVAVGVLHLRLLVSENQSLRFTDSQQRLATRVGEYIAIPLTNLRMRDELRSQAIRDPLTQLYNRRYMEETLEREIRRATRHSTSVGIIMFDIDRMKPINDRFGHDAGDLVLRSLGRELLSLFRGEDVACRYGGDEFTIVLPEASLADVWRRAEQLREAVKKLSLRYDGNEIGPLTLSIGVSAFPDHGLTAERVLLACDSASYASKSEGGDRIMVGHKIES